MSDIPVDPHQTTIDELSEELENLLDTFCSDTHQRFCLEQRVTSQQQLQRIRQTIQHTRQSSERWTSTTNSDSIRQSLMGTCLEMLNCYQAVCQHRHIRALSSSSHGRNSNVVTNPIHQLTLDWQQLSQSFEMKAREQSNLAALFDNLKNLRKAWTKKPRHIERLLTSLLVTYELRPGAYVVVIDRHNYHQLGLKRNTMGTRQLVFECSRISRQEQMDVVAGICDRFASVFAQNAQHNLAQIEAQVQLAQLSMLAKRLRKLQDQVFYINNTSSTIQQQSTLGTTEEDANRTEEDEEDEEEEDDVSSIEGNIGRSPMDPLPPPRHHRPRRRHHQRQQSNHLHQQQQRPFSYPITPTSTPAPPFNPFPSVTPSLWYIQDDTGIQSLPMPSFVPSPWQWPDLLKVNRPYDPLLFGLIKRKRQPPRPSRPTPSSIPRQQQQQPFIVRLKGLFSARTRYISTVAMGPSSTARHHHHQQTQQQHRHSRQQQQQQQQQHSNTTNSTSTEDDQDAVGGDTMTPTTTPPAPGGGGAGMGGGMTTATTTRLEEGVEDPPVAFASVSISHLCGHFCRTGRQFYEDVTSNAQLKHSQDGHILQEIGRDLVETYAAIQLEASRTNMQRILTILHELTVLDHTQQQHQQQQHQQQQHEDWDTSAVPQSTPAPTTSSAAAIAATTTTTTYPLPPTTTSSSFHPPPLSSSFIIDDHSTQPLPQQHHHDEDRRSSRIESHISLPPA
ncbi:hypothetical protein BDA99DRAFT_538784 [Phascolomyces articulosus]|uniref:Uncharacterized protein n=1 Tax=Phascolomyces articulosus TaxID=60185 RepID=A0AAD5PCF1_9FUNG|nr:hypothetical protein BDA99DRAFT_538784 [Phascolomyces articulosus]